MGTAAQQIKIVFEKEALHVVRSTYQEYIKLYGTEIKCVLVF